MFVVELTVWSPDECSMTFTQARVEATYEHGIEATRDDPGEPDGFYIDRCIVEFTGPMRQCVQDGQLYLQPQGQKQALINVSAAEMDEGYMVVDDPDLLDEIELYLLENET